MCCWRAVPHRCSQSVFLLNTLFLPTSQGPVPAGQRVRHRVRAALRAVCAAARRHQAHRRHRHQPQVRGQLVLGPLLTCRPHVGPMRRACQLPGASKAVERASKAPAPLSSLPPGVRPSRATAASGTRCAAAARVWDSLQAGMHPTTRSSDLMGAPLGSGPLARARCLAPLQAAGTSTASNQSAPPLPTTHAPHPTLPPSRQFGGRLAWGADAICSGNPAWGGRGARKTGDDYPAAPNIDHTQVRGAGALWARCGAARSLAHCAYTGALLATRSLSHPPIPVAATRPASSTPPRSASAMTSSSGCSTCAPSALRAGALTLCAATAATT